MIRDGNQLSKTENNDSNKTF